MSGGDGGLRVERVVTGEWRGGLRGERLVTGEWRGGLRGRGGDW